MFGSLAEQHMFRQFGLDINQTKPAKERNMQTIENQLDAEEANDRYQVFVTNIKWNLKSKVHGSKPNRNQEFPEHMSLDIPASVLVEIKKNKKNANDIIETFCYNLLTRKYGKEVSFCQIWLPFES